MFYMFLTYVISVFIWTLHMFSYIHCKCFSRMFQVFHLSFFFKLQMLHLNVLKVDQVLHMGCAWEAAGDGRRSGRRELAAGALARKPDALGRLLARCAGTASRR